RTDLPIAAQQPLALEQRQRQQPGEIFRVDLHQSGVVRYPRRDECDADWSGCIDAWRVILWPRQMLHQVFRSISPNELFSNAEVIAQDRGPLEAWKPGLLINPPCQEVRNPAVRVRVACRSDVRFDTAGRAVTADHVKKLMGREMCQFVETDQCNLSALPV